MNIDRGKINHMKREEKSRLTNFCLEFCLPTDEAEGMKAIIITGCILILSFFWEDKTKWRYRALQWKGILALSWRGVFYGGCPTQVPRPSAQPVFSDNVRILRACSGLLRSAQVCSGLLSEHTAVIGEQLNRKRGSWSCAECQDLCKYDVGLAVFLGLTEWRLWGFLAMRLLFLFFFSFLFFLKSII